ncbi:MAG TPA: phosphatase PAP2 family protein [Solirubrobacteraceae bacterium]|jgi:membrane-associated phospholipid phosphatase|nr:phosphatase PAP2 family protein [Solirubrobacteraceae bacterium]
MHLRRWLGSLDRGGPRPALRAALACAVGLVATGVVALLVPVARAGDAGTLRGFVALNRPRLTPLADLVAHSVDALPYAVAGLVLVSVALARRRPWMALVIAVAMPASVLTCELLKPLLSDIRHIQWFGGSSVGEASWPSGHAAGAMCLALCAVLVSPRRLRPFAVAAGSALAVGVSFSILMLVWHFPSDVLGGFLVAALWVALGIAALRALDDGRRQQVSIRQPEPLGSLLAPLVPAAVAAGGLAAAALLHPEAVTSFATEHKPFVLGAFIIAAMAWALASGLAVALRR